MPLGLAEDWKADIKKAPLKNGAFRIHGAQGRNRTVDTRIFSPLLYRLSYLGEISCNAKVANFCSGAQGRNRTVDTRIFSPLLYRLSYLGI